MLVTAPLLAGEQRLVFKDGFELIGVTTQASTIVQVQSGGRNYAFSHRLLLESEATDQALPDRFVITQPTIAGKSRPVSNLDRIIRITEFDEHGRRTVTATDGKHEAAYIQAITEVYPTHVVLTGLNRTWTSTLDIQQIPEKTLVGVLKKAIKTDSATDRLRLVRFLIDAGRLREARTEVQTMKEQFTDPSAGIGEVEQKLHQSISERTVALIEKADRLGQVQRVAALHDVFKSFTPPPALLARVDVIDQRLDEIRMQRDRADKLLATLQAAIQQHPQHERLSGWIELMRQDLSAATAPRLRPLLELADQAGVEPTELLALGLSGWVLGPELASKELDRAIGLTQAADLLASAVQADDEASLLEIHRQMLDLKITADVAAQLVRQLPAPAPEVPIGQPTSIDWTPPGSDKPIVIRLLLPPEYDRRRQYPLILCLRGSQVSAEQLLSAWAPGAIENGCIVAAPEWRTDPSKGYRYSTEEHQLILGVLTTLRKQFAVDADRVFLTGHEMGGFAAWDIGMAHPDQFAGLIPFCAVPMFYCNYYESHAEHLPIYAVEGSLNGENPAQLHAYLKKLMLAGYPTLYSEQPGHGREMFLAELPRIFSWLEPKRRPTAPAKFEASIARAGDHQAYWVKGTSVLENATVTPELFGKKKIRPAKITASVNNQNTLQITTSGLGAIEVQIPLGLAPPEDPNFVIKTNRGIAHKGKFEPELMTLLRHLRLTGDRKRLIIKTFAIPRL